MVPRRLFFSGLFLFLVAATASAGANQWTPLGPYGPTGVIRVGGLAVSPEAVFAASQFEGVFRSTDRGAHWDLVLPGPPSFWALAVDPSDSSIVYAVTDNLVYRSEDSGTSWTANALSGRVVQTLAVDRDGTLWAGTADMGTSRGSVLRSANGGGSWEEMLSSLSGDITSIAIEPGSSSTLYAGSRAGEILRTRDGGQSWVNLEPAPGAITAIAIDPVEPMRVYATVSLNAGVCAICLPDWMVRTEDGGDTFTSIGQPGNFLLSIAIAPDATLFVGSGERVYRSLDHGDTFAPIEAQTPIKPVSLAFDPDDPKRLYGATWEGVFKIEMTPEALYLLDGRFEVTVVRHTSPSGPDILATAVPISGNAGYFWFFDPANVEVVVKILDGTYVNGHIWVFYASLSNVPYTVTVTDLTTGETRTYENPAGRLASVADTSAFPGTSAPRTAGPNRSASQTREDGAACSPGSTTLCLQGGRFEVRAGWQRSPLGPTREARAVPLTGDTGYFYFFDESNVELVVKVLDGRPVNGHFWVFYGALSNLLYTITVTDTQTGEMRTYVNPSGKLASVADTSAF